MYKVLAQIAMCFWLALVGVGCGPDSIEVLVRVISLNPEVTSIKVSALLNGHPALSEMEFTDGLHQFGVKLPLVPSSQGKLKLNVVGLANDRCTVSVGTADTNLTLEALYSEVELTMVAQEKVCPLSIEKAGEGTVIVATFAKVVDCSAGCQLDLPYGSQVTLTTMSPRTIVFSKKRKIACSAAALQRCSES